MDEKAYHEVVKHLAEEKTRDHKEYEQMIAAIEKKSHQSFLDGIITNILSHAAVIVSAIIALLIVLCCLYLCLQKWCCKSTIILKPEAIGLVPTANSNT